MIKVYTMKGVREEYVFLSEFWTDLGLLHLWSFFTFLTTRAVYENNVYRKISPQKDR